MKQEIIKISNAEITLEIGEIAKQANGSVILKQNGTVILVTAVSEGTPKEGMDFFPLLVEYREKTAAAGKIPGGFIKRESKPKNHEILNCRIIDRSIRPLFPDNYRCDTQVISTVLSYDPDTDPAALSVIGTAVALSISDIPWNGPLGAIRLIRKNGKLIAFPTENESKNSELDVILSCSREGVVMLEGIAEEIKEEDIIDVIEQGQKLLEPVFKAIENLQKELGKEKREVEKIEYPEDVKNSAVELGKEKLLNVILNKCKIERRKNLKICSDEIKEKLLEMYPEKEEYFSGILHDMVKNIFREYMVTEKKRIDGRNFEEIRDISGKVSWLPRVHGSSLFTRGETQAVVSCTLGSIQDEQIVETLDGEESQNFMLHYNFPPYCVGEVSPMRGPGRREIGHGTLATRSLIPILPDKKEFPYTIRLVSDITESNGSSSMATVCGGCMALKDAGIPIKNTVAGVAMGLLKEKDEFIILSDIMGDEDHMGDMDFKVAGTADGVTAVQMDNKIGSLSREIFVKALEQARKARLHIIKEMNKIIEEPRKELNKFAPRVKLIKIRKERIRELIGPGGKIIQELQERHQINIDIDSYIGEVRIFAKDDKSCKNALKDISYIISDPEVGKFYKGKVVAVKDFGAFVRILANTEGLVHISELDNSHVRKVRDVVKEGDEVIVKVIGVDRNGKIKLSRKEALDVKDIQIEG